MTRGAVLPKSNTVTGVIAPVYGENRFRYLGVKNAEMLEICKFVWPNGIFPQRNLFVAVDPCGQIEK